MKPPVVVAARRGPGANCSSLGSAVDALYLGAAAVGALLAAASVVLAEEQATEERAAEPPADGAPTAPSDGDDRGTG